MKALSIRPPWTWAILNGKPVENRSQPTYFTGPFLIHASQTFEHEGYRWILKNRHLFEIEIPHRDDFQMGGIVGKAKIIDCVDWHPSPFFFGKWGYVIENAEPLPFFPCKGKVAPKFFEVEYPDGN